MAAGTAARRLSTLLLLLLAAAAIVSGDKLPHHGMTHFRLYSFASGSGANPTVVESVPSPINGSTFGAISVFDNILRRGSNPGSPAVGTEQGLAANTESDSKFSFFGNVVFTGGEYKGSSLAVLGAVDYVGKPVEYAIVGGTGVFRMARGYVLSAVVSDSSPTRVDVLDFYVAKY